MRFVIRFDIAQIWTFDLNPSQTLKLNFIQYLRFLRFKKYKFTGIK